MGIRVGEVLALKENPNNMLFLTPDKKLVLHSTVNNQLKRITKKSKYKEEELKKANEYYLNNEIFDNNSLKPPIIEDYEINEKRD